MTAELNELTRVVEALPPGQAREVLDFALFLRDRRAAKPVDFSWEWSEEDIRDLTASDAHRLDEMPPAEVAPETVAGRSDA